MSLEELWLKSAEDADETLESIIYKDESTSLPWPHLLRKRLRESRALLLRSITVQCSKRHIRKSVLGLRPILPVKMKLLQTHQCFETTKLEAEGVNLFRSRRVLETRCRSWAIGVPWLTVHCRYMENLPDKASLVGCFNAHRCLSDCLERLRRDGYGES